LFLSKRSSPAVRQRDLLAQALALARHAARGRRLGRRPRPLLICYSPTVGRVSQLGASYESLSIFTDARSRGEARASLGPVITRPCLLHYIALLAVTFRRSPSKSCLEPGASLATQASNCSSLMACQDTSWMPALSHPAEPLTGEEWPRTRLDLAHDGRVPSLAALARRGGCRRRRRRRPAATGRRRAPHRRRSAVWRLWLRRGGPAAAADLADLADLSERRQTGASLGEGRCGRGAWRASLGARQRRLRSSSTLAGASGGGLGGGAGRGGYLTKSAPPSSAQPRRFASPHCAASASDSARRRRQTSPRGCSTESCSRRTIQPRKALGAEASESTSAR